MFGYCGKKESKPPKQIEKRVVEIWEFSEGCGE